MKQTVIELQQYFHPRLSERSEHILCLSEHHLRQFQLQHITMDDYILGGVCIFIQKHLPFSIFNIEKFCKDKELEACAVKRFFVFF
jgi:hypothetical protein